MRWKTVRANLVVVPALGLALAINVGMWATPSSAAIPGLERVIATSQYDSTDSKAVPVLCPSGKKLLSLGGRLHPTRAADNVTIFRISPITPDLLHGGAFAFEHAPYEGNWSIIAEAVCADPLPGLEMVTAFTPAAANQQQSVTISCPMDKNILGTGFVLHFGIFQGERRPRVTSLFLHSQGRAATIRALAINPITPWQIEAHAICADPLPGLERRADVTTYSLDLVQVALAQCPPPKRATGSGFRIDDATGLANFAETYTCCGTSPAGALARARRPPNSSVTPWRLRSYVICASP